MIKYLVILAVVLAGCSGDSELSSKLRERDIRALKFAHKLEPGDCFRYEEIRKATHNFEMDYLFRDNVYVVIAKDYTGLLIAQPKPGCEFTSDESHRCHYWFRTVPYMSLYLIHGEEKKVKCHSELSLSKMIKRLKNSNYAPKYRVNELKYKADGHGL